MRLIKASIAFLFIPFYYNASASASVASINNATSSEKYIASYAQPAGVSSACPFLVASSRPFCVKRVGWLASIRRYRWITNVRRPRRELTVSLESSCPSGSCLLVRGSSNALSLDGDIAHFLNNAAWTIDVLWINKSIAAIKFYTINHNYQTVVVDCYLINATYSGGFCGRS